MASPALLGLVLAGGASTRMRTDKAALQYHGQPQLHWAFDLVSKFCAATFVSVRPDQRDDAARAGHPQIVDRQPGIGPLAGISAALLEHPKAAWLVLAAAMSLVLIGASSLLVRRRTGLAPAAAAPRFRKDVLVDIARLDEERARLSPDDARGAERYRRLRATLLEELRRAEER